jgi:hypothetical protein
MLAIDVTRLGCIVSTRYRRIASYSDVGQCWRALARGLLSL